MTARMLTLASTIILAGLSVSAAQALAPGGGQAGSAGKAQILAKNGADDGNHGGHGGRGGDDPGGHASLSGPDRIVIARGGDGHGGGGHDGGGGGNGGNNSGRGGNGEAEARGRGADDPPGHR